MKASSADQHTMRDPITDPVEHRTFISKTRDIQCASKRSASSKSVHTYVGKSWQHSFACGVPQKSVHFSALTDKQTRLLHRCDSGCGQLCKGCLTLFECAIDLASPPCSCVGSGV